MARSLLIALLLPFIVATLPSTAQNKQQRNPANSGPKPYAQEFSGGFWRVDNRFQSTLRIRNTSVELPVSATPVLYMADGAKYELAPVKLQPAAAASVEISDALRNAPPEMSSHISTFGGAALKFTALPGTPAVAVVNVIDGSGTIAFTFPLQPTVKAPNRKTNRIEGLWWQPDTETGGFISLVNTTTETIAATVELFDSFEKNRALRQMSLAPHASAIADLTPMIAELRDRTTEGGIRVTYEGSAGAVVVHGALENTGKGYSLEIPRFVNAALASRPVRKHQTVAAVGVPIGSPEGLGLPQQARLSPFAVLRNTTAGPVRVGVTLYYMGADAPRTVELPPHDLSAYETRQVELGSAVSGCGLDTFDGRVNILFTFDAEDGEVGILAGSMDASHNHIFGAGPQPLRATHGRQVRYSNVAGRDSTVLTIWNYGEQPENPLLTVFFPAGEYKVPLQLAGKASVSINIADLIREQRPDMDGKTIPPDTREGSASVVTGQVGKPMNVAISATAVEPNNIPECQYCCGYDNLWIAPGSFSLAVGSTQTFWAYGGGCMPTVDLSAYCGWFSTDPLIADFIAPELPDVLSGISPGEVGIWADFSASGFVGPTGWACGQFDLNGNPIYECPLPIINPPTAPGNVIPVVSITSPAPTAVPVAQAQPIGSQQVVGINEVYISATCAPQGVVNPQFNWTITQGANQVKLDTNDIGGPTMGIIGVTGGAPNGVVISVTCTDLNTNQTSSAQTATMTAQQPGSLTIPPRTPLPAKTVQLNNAAHSERLTTK